MRGRREGDVPIYICMYTIYIHVRPRYMVRARELAPVLVCARGKARPRNLSAARGEGTATGTLYIRE